MKVFRRSVRLPEGTLFTYKENQENSPSALTEKIVEDAIERLFQLHDTFAPTRPGTVNINIDSSDTAEKFTGSGSVHS